MEDTIKTYPMTKFDNIVVYKEDDEKLLEVLKRYLDNPKHLILNLSMCDELSDDFLDKINFLSTILKSNNYSLQVFSPSSSVHNKLDSHRFRNLNEAEVLSNYIQNLDAIERELRISSLLKDYVDESMKYIFGKSGIILKRGELSIQESPNTFLQEMNYFQTFQLENAFFSFVFGGKQDFFKDFLSALGETELAPVFNKIQSQINPELLQDITVHDYLTHPYDQFPTETITLDGKEYPYFKNCSVMQVPLECELGEFNLEIWIPNNFTATVYRYLNP